MLLVPTAKICMSLKNGYQFFFIRLFFILCLNYLFPDISLFYTPNPINPSNYLFHDISLFYTPNVNFFT